MDPMLATSEDKQGSGLGEVLETCGLALPGFRISGRCAGFRCSGFSVLAACRWLLGLCGADCAVSWFIMVAAHD